MNLVAMSVDYVFLTVASRIAFLFSNRATVSTAFNVAIGVVDGVRSGNGALKTLRGSPPSVLRDFCEKMGATYIKVGGI